MGNIKIKFASALLLLTSLLSNQTAFSLDKFSLAGWSKPISEITNILAEPDKGFF